MDVKALRRLAARLFDPESQRLIRNSSWLFLAQAITSILTLARSILIARLLGLETYGTYVVTLALVATTQGLLKINVAGALIKFGLQYRVGGDRERSHAVVKAGYVISGATALVAAIAVIVSTLLAYDLFIDVPALEVYVVLLALASSLSFFDDTTLSVVRLCERFRLYSTIIIVASLAEFVVLMVSVLGFDAGLELLLVAFILGRLLTSVVTNVTAYFALRPTFRGFSLARITSIRHKSREMWIFLWSDSLSLSLAKLGWRADVLFLSWLLGSASVGYYDVAKKLAFSLLSLKTPISLAVFPQVGSLMARKKWTELRIMIRTLFRLSILPVLASLWLAFLLGESIITLTYGEEFSGAWLILFYLSCTAVLETVLFWSNAFILNVGRVRAKLYNTVAFILIQFGLAIWLVPGYGAVAMSLSMLVSVLIFNAIYLRIIYAELERGELATRQRALSNA